MIAVVADNSPKIKNSYAADLKMSALLAPMACIIAVSFVRWSLFEYTEAIKARIPAMNVRKKIYCTANEALANELLPCSIIATN